MVVVEEGSGVAQASLEAQGSAVEKFENALEARGADFEGAWEAVGAERLKAEFRAEEGAGGLLVGVGPFVGGGSEKSKSSFRFDPPGRLGGAAVLGGLKLRSPKPNEIGLGFGTSGF